MWGGQRNTQIRQLLGVRLVQGVQSCFYTRRVLIGIRLAQHLPEAVAEVDGAEGADPDPPQQGHVGRLDQMLLEHLFD